MARKTDDETPVIPNPFQILMDQMEDMRTILLDLVELVGSEDDPEEEEAEEEDPKPAKGKKAKKPEQPEEEEEEEEEEDFDLDDLTDEQVRECAEEFEISGKKVAVLRKKLSKIDEDKIVAFLNEDDDEDEEVTMDDLKELCATLLEGGARDVKTKILKKYKAQSITKVAQKNFDAIYEDLFDAVEALKD